MTSQIEVDLVSKSFRGGALVLDRVSFVCPAGQVTAFLGPNGAGKTTTLRIAAGLSRPDSGRVLFGGRSLSSFSQPAREVGFCLDAATVHPGRSVLETMTLAALVCGLPKAKASAREMVARVGLGSVARRRVGKLSLGMRQRLGLGCALIGRPHTLVLDEPVNGLDVEGVLWVRSVVRDLVDAGGTVLLSSHLLKEVETVADRIVVLDRGKVVAQGVPADLVPADRSVAVVQDPERLEPVLTMRGVTFSRDGEKFTVNCDPRALGRLAADHGIALARLDVADDADLEGVFLRLTRGEFVAARPDRGDASD